MEELTIEEQEILAEREFARAKYQGEQNSLLESQYEPFVL